MREAKEVIVEAIDIKKMIKDLGGNFAQDNKSQLAGVSMLKGLATSDDPLANKFMKELDKCTTAISKKLTESTLITVNKEIVIGDVILEKGDKVQVL